jgi:paraquat-inducible protein A
VYNCPLSDVDLIACPHCDLVQRLPALGEGASARCPRCDKELRRRPSGAPDKTLALTIGAALLFALANAVPMLGLSVVGHQAATTVVGGAQQLWNDGREIVAVLVLFTAVVAPGLQIGFLLAIAIGARHERPRRWVGTLLRHQPMTATWSMIEVMLLGVLVALIKIADYATVVPGTALFVLGALVFLLAAMQSSFDPREIWSRIEWADPHGDRAARGIQTGGAVR